MSLVLLYVSGHSVPYVCFLCLQLALQQWEASEAEKRRLQHEIALKLKQEREQQLVEKNSRRANVSMPHIHRFSYAAADTQAHGAQTEAWPLQS